MGDAVGLAGPDRDAPSADDEPVPAPVVHVIGGVRVKDMLCPTVETPGRAT